MPIKKIKSWSFSKWAMFHTCAYKFKKTVLEGIKPPQSPYADRGERIHSLAEQYALGNIKGMPNELKKFGDEFKEIRSLVKSGSGFTEQEWACTSTWESCGWMSKNVWLRGKCDYHGVEDVDVKKGVKGTHIDIIDYKTGRQYPTHSDQSKLYSVMGMHRYENVVSVHVEFWYLDSGDFVEYNYTRKQLEKLSEYWSLQGRKILKSTGNFSASVGGHCRYCHLRDDKGGQCKSWRKL